MPPWLGELNANLRDSYFSSDETSVVLLVVRPIRKIMLRRSRQEILFGILKSCAFERLSFYQLMIAQNLSHKLLKSYLDRLANSELVKLDIEGRRRVVVTTKAGLEALKHYRNAVSLLNSEA